MLRKYILLALAALLLCSAAGAAPRTYRLTVVNKSGLPVELRLVQQVASDQTAAEYYLRVPTGSPSDPARRDFDLVGGKYQMTLYYIELHDPVYGNTCTPQSSRLTLDHKQRLAVADCTRPAASKAKPGRNKPR